MSAPALTPALERVLRERVAAGDLDARIARALGRGWRHHHVRAARARLGLPLAQRVRSDAKRLACVEALRAGASFAAAARAAGVYPKIAAEAWRRHCGGAQRPPGKRARTAQEARAHYEATRPGIVAAIESGASYSAIGTQHGVSRARVGQIAAAIGIRRGWGVDVDAVVSLLSTCSDREIARRVGCAASTVSKIRRERGVARPSRVAPRGARPWDVDLGVLADVAIARREGLRLGLVRMRRVRLGIAPHRTRIAAIDWDRALRLYRRGRSYAAIARALRCQESTLRSRLPRLLRRTSG